MTSDKSRHVEVKREDQTIAAADVTPLDNPEGTVRTTLLPSSGPCPASIRADLVDAVMDLPEVQGSSRLEATIPVGDAGSLERLRERTEETVARPAGSTVLVDGNIAPAPGAGRGKSRTAERRARDAGSPRGQEPDGGEPGS